MPTVTRENIGLLNDKITVTVQKEDYLPSFEKALKYYAKSANIPGFRKGMVPPGMIKKMHGPGVFTEEVLRSIEKSLTEYLQEQKLDIFAQPLPVPDNNTGNINMNEPKEYSFAFEIGLKPSFEIADLAKENVTRYKIEATEAMIDEEISRMQSRLGKMTEPEEVNSDENVLNLSFAASDKTGQVAEDAAVRENSLLVKYFSEATRKNLMGKKKGDSLLITLGDAFEEREREWLIGDLGLDKDDPANLEKTYKMTITKIGLVEKRPLDESFFAEAMPGKNIKTEAEFRDAIKEEIQKYWETQSRNQLQHHLYHVLLDHTTMEFPETFLKRWLQTSGDKPKTEEEVETQFPAFKDQLKWTLVSDKIVRDNQVQVSRDEIMDHMKKQVMGYFGTMNLEGSMDWLDSYVEKMMHDEEQVEGTYRRIITEKVFEWAENQINPTEEIISSEDFLKKQEEHQHHHH